MATTVIDVAHRAGVSVGTVSNVLNSPHKVAPSTISRVQDAIDELGFVRNDAARQLRAGSSLCLGMVVLDIANPFFADVARGAEEAATEHGLSLLLADSGASSVRERTLLELFETQRVKGVMISPVDADTSHLLRLRQHDVPAVLVDRMSEGEAFSSISVDDVEGGRQAVAHLATVGRTSVVFVGGPPALAQVRDRLAGAQAAADAAGIRLEVMHVSALTVEEGVRAGGLLRESGGRYDGVFAANDLLALGVLQGVGYSGDVRVPDELAIVGYDDILFAAAAAIPISSIHQPRHEMGRRAVELLLAEIEGTEPRRQVVLQPHLVARRSSERTRQGLFS